MGVDLDEGLRKGRGFRWGREPEEGHRAGQVWGPRKSHVWPGTGIHAGWLWQAVGPWDPAGKGRRRIVGGDAVKSSLGLSGFGRRLRDDLGDP